MAPTTQNQSKFQCWNILPEIERFLDAMEKKEIVSAQPITLQTSKLTHDAMCDDVYTIKRDF